MGADSDEWHVTTDPTRVRAWADEHGAVPVRDPDTPGATDLEVVSPQAQSNAGGDVDAEQIPWDQFEELFEAEELAFRYRAADPESTAPASQLVDRDEVAESAAEAEAGATGTSAQSVASDQIVASDTGDAEPIVEDRVESESDAESTTGDREAGRNMPRTDQSQQDTDADAPESAMSESAHGAEEQPLVLDEIYEDPGGLGSDPDDEYVVLRNDGEERLDLGGWRIENGVDASFEFPEGFVLEPGDDVTVHSGEGRDTDSDLHWRADDAVWDQKGGTVIVRSPAGDRVLREPYKDG